MPFTGGTIMNNPECDVCPNDNNTGQMLVEIEL
jgi:hypothetical protein